MKRQRKVKLGILVILLIIALAVACAEMIRLMNPNNKVVRDLDRCITSTWEKGDAEIGLRKTGTLYDTSFIIEEYEALKKYRNHEFKNKSLEEDVISYIDALGQCRDVIRRINPNKEYERFWEEFSEPYGQRLKAIFRLYKGKYGLTLDEKEHTKAKDYVLFQGWAIDKAESLKFRYPPINTKDRELIATVKNDSGYEIEYIDISINLYDDNGNLSENVSAYAEDIDKGSSFDLRIFPMKDIDIKQYAVTEVNCKAFVKNSKKIPVSISQ